MLLLNFGGVIAFSLMGFFPRPRPPDSPKHSSPAGSNGLGFVEDEIDIRDLLPEAVGWPLVGWMVTIGWWLVIAMFFFFFFRKFIVY